MREVEEFSVRASGRRRIMILQGKPTRFVEAEELMSKARRTIKSSARPGTVKPSQVRSAARQIKQEREASGRHLIKR